jgi:hypothetical protein
MIARRAGSTKNHGWTTLIGDRKPTISWDKTTNSVLVWASYVPDVHQANVMYDWAISFPIEDVADFIGVISADGIPGMPREVHEAFRGKLPELVRLAACATGNTPIPLPPASPAR